MLERLFFLYIIVAFTTLRGQTTLTAGDLMMVTVNADGDDNFDFVPLVDLESNTVIYFADNAWDGSALKSNEGTLKYTSSSSVSAGTIVSYSGSLGGEWANEDAGFLIAATGDNILVFQGSPSDPTFIYGIGWALGTVWISEGDVSTHNSYIPSGISTSDNTVVQLGTSDNYQYDTDNGTSGPKSTLRYLIAQNGNYNFHNSNFFSALSGSFDVGQVISGSSDHFRMMSSPVAGEIYGDLLDELWTQGMTGADATSGDANVWNFDLANQSFTSDPIEDISSSGESLTAGQGFLIYVYTNTDNSGATNDLPVTLSVAGTENSGNVTVPSSGSIADDAWAFAGNPYASTIDWDLVTQTAVTTSCYVWDDATSAYKTWNKTSESGDLSNGLIAPYQGFWVQASGGIGEVTIETADKSGSAGTFYRTFDDNNRGQAVFNASSDGHSSSNYLSFYEGGTVGADEGESELLLPFQASSRVVMMSVVEGEAHKISSYPYDHEGTVSVPFDVMRLTLEETNYVTVAEEVTLTWNLEELPDHMELVLMDNATDAETHLDQESEYVFTTEPKGSFSAIYDGPIGTYPVLGEPRFTLNVTYDALDQNEDATLPSGFALHPAYPNPFNPSTTITFDVPAQSRHAVSLQLYDIKGQLVETLVNEVFPAGSHSMQWNPVNLSSGVYIVQLKAGETVFNQKITYIK